MPLPRIQACLSQNLACLHMDCGEIDRGGGPVGQQRGNEIRIDAPGKISIVKPCFQRESISIEPLIKREVQGPSKLRPLGRMDMEIDHTRKE